MKFSPARFCLLLVLAAVLAAVSGCETTETENNSPRPWNSPDNSQTAMPIQQEQHP